MLPDTAILVPDEPPLLQPIQRFLFVSTQNAVAEGKTVPLPPTTSSRSGLRTEWHDRSTFADSQNQEHRQPLGRDCTTTSRHLLAADQSGSRPNLYRFIRLCGSERPPCTERSPHLPWICALTFQLSNFCDNTSVKVASVLSNWISS